MSDQEFDFAPAMFVGLTLDQANALALLDFAKTSGESLRVAIPLVQVRNLQAEIERKLRKAQL